MSFLGEKELKEQIKSIIPQYRPKFIDSNKYELCLGASYCASDSKFRVRQAEDNQIVVNPGEFYFLETYETVEMPNDIMGFISIKASIKFKGLVNISGFHVDPHFKGKIVFSVLNAGPSPINLTIEEPLFQIWFAKLTSASESYNGKHQGQTGVTGKLLNDHMSGSDNASLGDLQRQIKDLDNKYENLKVLATLIAAAIIAIMFKVYFN